MGLVMSEPRYHRPYIAMGCDQQARVTPTKLTAAHLDRRIAEKQEARGLVALLLAKGVMEGPPPNPGLLARLLRALRAGLINLKRKNPCPK